MKKNIILLAVALVVLTATGCEKKTAPEAVPSTDPRAGMISMAPAQQGIVESPANLASASQRLSPLELTQKEYLDSYNEYVRLLRESGPQTIETLQALAIYQKKYQIYQMLLKAGGQTDKTEKAP